MTITKYAFLWLLPALCCIYNCVPAQSSRSGRAYNEAASEQQFRLLPTPAKMMKTGGSTLPVSTLTKIYLDGIDALPPVSASFPRLEKATAPGHGTVTIKVTPTVSGITSKEGYTLQVTGNEIVITAINKAGAFYGCQTLSQLIQDAKDQKTGIPVYSITDEPSIDYRAIHLDLKHHLDSTSYYYDLMDRLADLKVNAVMLEFEDKLRYSSQPAVGASHSISIEEFTKISNYAQERNIEISPLIQGLGHASFILKHPEYKHLRDDTASDWSFDPLNPETYEVQFGLYKDAMAATPHGRYLHIGGDEVGRLGMSDLAKKSGMKPFELQMYWLKKVCDFASENNRIPVFWDDMVFKLSGLYETTYDPSISKEEVERRWKENEKILNENIHLFPRNCVYMRWNYDNPNLPGNLKAIEWYNRNGLHVMAATAGQQIWPMLPKANSNFQAIKDFAKITAQQKLDGILLTLWDDASPHFETYWRGIHDFATFTWNYEDLSKEEAHARFRHRFYGPALADKYFAFQDTLEEAFLFWEKALINTGHRENYPGKIDVLSIPDKNSPGTWSTAHKEKLQKARNEVQRYKRTKEKITKALALAKRNKYTLEIFNQLNELQVYPAELLLKLEKYDRETNAQKKKKALNELQKTVNRFTSLRKNFEEVFTKTRILHNPTDYLMDQNHHHHLANGTRNSDWMYVYELAFLEKIKTQLMK